MANDTTLYLLCGLCTGIEFEKLLQNTIEEQIFLGRLESIFEKRGQCAFCDLVARTAVQTYGEGLRFLSHDGRPITCTVWGGYTGWTLKDVHEERKGEVGLAIRFHGHWDSRYVGFSSLARRLATHVGNEYLFCGRRLPEGQVDFDTIRLWIDICCSSHISVQQHSGCGSRKWESQINKPSKLRVIDVQDNRIVDLPDSQDYIALSYVWGNITTLKSTIENKGLLSCIGGLSAAAQKLPIAQTILDAMVLTRKIGFRYLWTDSLCIVQDDIVEKASLIDQMASIYLAAVTTIIAAAGSDANAGLPGVRPNSRTTPQIIARVSPGLSLVVPRLLKSNIDDSTWNTRGWTFQERLYSKRLLIFLPDAVYWQCRSVIWNEDVVHEGPTAEDNEMMDFRTRLRFLNPDESWYQELVTTQKLDDKIHLIRPPTLAEYDWVVQEYTQRTLTYPQDIERAFAGIESVLKLGLGEFLFGHPVSHLDITILWRPSEVLQRRNAPVSDNPSWSWMGWIGPVGYRAHFPNSRISAEDRSRPLLDWYKVLPGGGLARLPQTWEEIYEHVNRKRPNRLVQWEPLKPPSDLFLKQPNCWLNPGPADHRHLAFRTSAASFLIGNRREPPRSGTSASLTYDIYNGQLQWVGTATFHNPPIIGSQCEFIIISEAQLVGIPEVDKELHGKPEKYTFFNVLAVYWETSVQTWDKSGDLKSVQGGLVAHRFGCGVVSKEAWVNASPRWVDVLLG